MNTQIVRHVLLHTFRGIILIALVLPQCVFAEEWETLVEDLRSDSVRLNAQEAATELSRLIRDANPPGLREKLESLLEEPDYQMRQYALRLLIDDIYTSEAEWPEALMRNLVYGLRQDSIRGNARASFKLLLELKENYPLQLLEAELDGDDPQSRLLVAILLSRYWDESALSERRKMLLGQLLLENLRSDDVCLNAGEAIRQLSRLIRSESPRDIGGKLNSLLEDPDHQISGLASHLLTHDIYTSEAEWPEALMKHMVRGLSHDSVKGNARTSFGELFRLKENHPIQLLETELKGNDPQSRFTAAILLSRYGHESAPPERNEVLLRHLLDDGLYENSIPAYLALAWSGAENIRQLLNEFEPMDWQQAALIQCTASFHDIEWSPADDAIREQWLAKASQPYTHRTGRERKYAMAALYLDPERERFLRGKELPEALDRMFRAGRGVRGAANRMKWVASWFPILDPEPPYEYYSGIPMFLYPF